MPHGTSWYYKPVNSQLYPSISKQKDFLVIGGTTPRLNLKKSTKNGESERPKSAAPRYRSPDEEKNFVRRISKPTLSSRFRYECPRMSFTYTNRYLTWDDHYIWHRLDYLSDNNNCLWSRHGGLRPPTRT